MKREEPQHKQKIRRRLVLGDRTEGYRTDVRDATELQARTWRCKYILL
jgi:hypothetical protein